MNQLRSIFASGRDGVETASRLSLNLGIALNQPTLNEIDPSEDESLNRVTNPTCEPNCFDRTV
jgi:hypothetical protein